MSSVVCFKEWGGKWNRAVRVRAGLKARLLPPVLGDSPLAELVACRSGCDARTAHSDVWGGGAGAAVRRLETIAETQPHNIRAWYVRLS